MDIKKSQKKKLIGALEDNLCKKFSYFQKQLRNMDVIEQDSLLIINGNEMTDMFNIICCRGNVSKDAVSDAIHYFKDKNLPFAWWVGFEGEPDNLPRLLEEKGLKRSEEELAMAIELNSSIEFDIPQTLQIRQVNDHQTLHDFVQIITDVVPQEAKAIEQFFNSNKEIILKGQSPIEFYVGYVNSQPISTCSVYFSEKVAGIFDIITSPTLRGEGIGSSMTITAMKAALNKGIEICILTATNDAKFLYKKLGFKPLKAMWVYS